MDTAPLELCLGGNAAPQRAKLSRFLAQPLARTAITGRASPSEAAARYQMSNSNSGLDALEQVIQGQEVGFYLADHPGIKMKPAFLCGIDALAFQMSSAHLLSVNKPIYDLHALDAHL
jgi:hypothetical protein